MVVAWVAVENGAMVKITGLRRIWRVPLICWARVLPPTTARCSAFSGTTAKMRMATPTAAAVRNRNTPRQSVNCSAVSTGTVALMAPMPPVANMMALANGSLSAGSQSTNDLKAAIRHADTPNPISPRPAISAAGDAAVAKMKAPAAANISKAASVRRGPNLSSRMPSGSWNAAKVIM